MILEQGPSEGPDTSEDKVELIKFSGRVGRSVVLSQQAFQQGTQSLIGSDIEKTSELNMYLMKRGQDRMEQFFDTWTEVL